MANAHKFKVEVSKPMDISALTNDYPLAVMTGTAAQTFTQEQKDALKKYVAQGGTLFIDAAGGSAEFYQSADALITGLWGRLKPLAGNCQIYKPSASPELAIDTVSYTEKGSEIHPGKKDGGLRGVLDKDDRITVILSRDDVTAGLIGALTKPIAGYSPDSAYRIMRNVVMAVQKNSCAGATNPAATTFPSATSRPATGG
jgi:hypothetical protein